MYVAHCFYVYDLSYTEDTKNHQVVEHCFESQYGCVLLLIMLKYKHLYSYTFNRSWPF